MLSSWNIAGFPALESESEQSQVNQVNFKWMYIT